MNKSENLMSVKLDWTFKELMLKEEIRNSFISSVLDKKVKSSTILNTFLRKDYGDDKLGILDVRVEIEGETDVDIEMQVVPFKQWAERTLFYISKMYVERIEAGDKYNVLKKCINISILDFNYLPESDYFNSFHIRNDKTHNVYTDKMGFYIIELPKIPKEIETMDDLVMWCKFIDSNSEEEMKMLATKNDNIEIAYEELKKLSFDDEKRMEYEARQKAIRDYNELMYEAEERGLEQGIKQGIEQGIEQGIKQGIEQGIEQGRMLTAKNLLSMGLTIEQVCTATGLEDEQLKNL